jgi:hypothetical protein
MLNTKNSKVTNVEPFLDKAINQISQLLTLYEEGFAKSKTKIIGSLFSEKLTFKIINFEPIELMKD